MATPRNSWHPKMLSLVTSFLRWCSTTTTTCSSQWQATGAANLSYCCGSLHHLHCCAKGRQGVQPLACQPKLTPIAPEPQRVNSIMRLRGRLVHILNIAAKSADQSISPALMLLRSSCLQVKRAVFCDDRDQKMRIQALPTLRATAYHRWLFCLACHWSVHA